MHGIRMITTLSVLGCAAVASAGERPNVLLVITDQQRWSLISALHGSEFVSTLNIDRLAKRGLVLSEDRPYSISGLVKNQN